MSNFCEQNMRCVEFEVSKEQAIEAFYNTLILKKIPEDVFEKTTILRCDKIYFPQYLFIADYNYISEVGIHLLNSKGKETGNTIYQTVSGTLRYSLSRRATVDCLSFIPDSFFPDCEFCLKNISKEIEPSLPDVSVCSDFSRSWQNVYNSDEVTCYIKNQMKHDVCQDVKKRTSNMLGSQWFNSQFTNKYHSDMGDFFDYDIGEPSVYSILIPAYEISHNYNNETYKSYANGCNVLKGRQCHII